MTFYEDYEWVRVGGGGKGAPGIMVLRLDCDGLDRAIQSFTLAHLNCRGVKGNIVLTDYRSAVTYS